MKLLVAIAIASHAGDALADRVHHVPPADAEAGSAVELVAEAPATTPTLTAHVRTTGQVEFHAIELVRRDDARWVAVVPPTEVAAPGLEYFVEAGGEPVFATAAWPHTLPVHVSVEGERRSRDLTRASDRRSRIHAMGELVDYGTHGVAGTPLHDRYYRLDVDFAYKLLAYPLEELRVGYTGLLGDAQSTMCPSTPCTQQAGFKVGGWFELGLAALEGIRFDVRAMVLATRDGFNPGARAEARLGDREASHVALGAEYLADVGSDGYFRLGWGTVPRWPMAATVEVANLPSSTNDLGIRLYYDLGHDFGNGVRIGVRAGYAARVSSIAGFTGGAGASVDF